MTNGDLTNGDYIALAALFVSAVALLLSLRFWTRSFRPLVTAMVKTHSAGNVSTAFNLTVQNSGTIPARNVTLHVPDWRKLEAALAKAPDEERTIFLKCFNKNMSIPVLQNGTDTSCSFGYCSASGGGFWRHHAVFPIWVRYEGWFGKVYCEEQVLKIADSTSFTGGAWRDKNAT